MKNSIEWFGRPSTAAIECAIGNNFGNGEYAVSIEQDLGCAIVCAVVHSAFSRIDDDSLDADRGSVRRVLWQPDADQFVPGPGLGAMIAGRRRWIAWFPLILAVTVSLMAKFHA